MKREALFDLFANKIPRGLRFNDKASMARGCELRVPFLDHSLVHLGFSIQDQFLIDKEVTKKPLRDVLSRLGYQKNAIAKKRSVQSPQREWLSADWLGFVKIVLDDSRTRDRGWIDVDKALTILSDINLKSFPNTFFIWQWLNTELWARHFLD